jgi:hypothetical protein
VGFSAVKFEGSSTFGLLFDDEEGGDMFLRNVRVTAQSAA